MGLVSYGSGAITDGRFHLNVNVTNFNLNPNPALGAHVRIQGEIRRNRFETLVLQVLNMADISVIDNEIMTPAALRGGYRIPGRVIVPDAVVVVPPIAAPALALQPVANAMAPLPVADVSVAAQPPAAQPANPDPVNVRSDAAT